jgi:hypothetical protein
MKKKLYAAIAAAALAVIPATAALADGHDTAEVVIVHGVPGFSADIAVNGDVAYEAVEFNTVVTADLPAGDYDLEVRAAGETDAVLSGSASLEEGMSYSVVAALDADGNPTLLVFGNASEEGIQVTHAAGFPNVDITPTDVTGLADVASGVTGFAATGAGTFEGLGVAAAGADENAIDLPALTVAEGEALLVYAIGPNEGDELPTLATQSISVAADMDADTDEDVAAPTEVDSGTGGLLETGLPMWVAALMVLGALGVAAPAVAAARRS